MKEIFKNVPTMAQTTAKPLLKPIFVAATWNLKKNISWPKQQFCHLGLFQPLLFSLM